VSILRQDVDGITGSEAWHDYSDHETLRRVVFGFKLFGRLSGPLIEVDVDAVTDAAAMKMVLLPLFYFGAPVLNVRCRLLLLRSFHNGRLSGRL